MSIPVFGALLPSCTPAHSSDLLTINRWAALSRQRLRFQRYYTTPRVTFVGPRGCHTTAATTTTTSLEYFYFNSSPRNRRIVPSACTRGVGPPSPPPQGHCNRADLWGWLKPKSIFTISQDTPWISRTDTVDLKLCRELPPERGCFTLPYANNHVLELGAFCILKSV